VVHDSVGCCVALKCIHLCHVSAKNDHIITSYILRNNNCNIQSSVLLLCHTVYKQDVDHSYSMPLAIILCTKLVPSYVGALVFE